MRQPATYRPRQFIQSIKDDHISSFKRHIENPRSNISYDQPLDDSGQSALLMAAQHPGLKIFHFLLHKKFNVNHTNARTGNSAVAELVSRRNPTPLREYLRLNPNVHQLNPQGRDACAIALDNVDFEAFNLLTAHVTFNINFKYPDGDTLLHKAVRVFDTPNRFIEHLVSLGGDPSITNSQGDTAFKLACDSQKHGLVNFFITRKYLSLPQESPTPLYSEPVFIPFLIKNGNLHLVEEFTQDYRILKSAFPNFSNCGDTFLLPNDLQSTNELKLNTNSLAQMLVLHIRKLGWNEIILAAVGRNINHWACLHYLYTNNVLITERSLNFSALPKDFIVTGLDDHDKNQYAIFNALTSNIATLHERLYNRDLRGMAQFSKFALLHYGIRLSARDLTHFVKQLTNAISATYNTLLNSIHIGRGATTSKQTNFSLSLASSTYIPFVINEHGILVHSTADTPQIIDSRNRLHNIVLSHEDIAAKELTDVERQALLGQITKLQVGVIDHLERFPLNRLTEPALTTTGRGNYHLRTLQRVSLHYLYFLNAGFEVEEHALNLPATTIFSTALSDNDTTLLTEFNHVSTDIVRAKYILSNRVFSPTMDFTEFCEAFYNAPADPNVLQDTFIKITNRIIHDYEEPIIDQLSHSTVDDIIRLLENFRDYFTLLNKVINNQPPDHWLRTTMLNIMDELTQNQDIDRNIQIVFNNLEDVELVTSLLDRLQIAPSPPPGLAAANI